MKIEDIDLIIVATTTPDLVFPATAAIVQAKLGAVNAFAFDVQAVCAGFLTALITANSLMIADRKIKNALVIGAETMTKILNWEDRSTCILFADGAGAVILQNHHSNGIIDFDLNTDGSQADILKTSGGTSFNKSSGFVMMEGPKVFKSAINLVSQSVVDLLNNNNLAANDISLFISHQANIRIIHGIADRLNISHDFFHVTVDKHANTSAASIPLALDDAFNNNLIKKGDKVVLAAIGAGLVWGSCLVEF